MPAGASAQVSVTFEDVAVRFSQEEWEGLEEWQKELYKEVMKENYQTLRSLGTGSPTITPEIISHIERGEEPYIRDEPGSEEGGTGKSSCSEIDDFKRRHKETHPEEHREVTETLSEEERRDTCLCCDWEANSWIRCKPEESLRNPAGDSADNVTPCGERTSDTSKSMEQSKCNECGNCYKDQRSLKSHQCTESGKNFKLKESITKHLSNLTRERSFLSTECVESFSLKQQMRVHAEECSQSISRQQQREQSACHILPLSATRASAGSSTTVTAHQQREQSACQVLPLMERERESPPPSSSKVAAKARGRSRKPRFTEADVDLLARLILLDERNLYTPPGCRPNLRRESAAWASLQEEFCRRASYPREIEDLKKKARHLRLHEGRRLEEVRRTLSRPLPESHTGRDEAGLPGPSRSCHQTRDGGTSSQWARARRGNSSSNTSPAQPQFCRTSSRISS
ncbi:zinc finger protein 354A-like isoform X3 [Rhinatrema bivittatum]|uniref:zinc finger protein 354A-like isoform X3 n=1 Tax=Rhinatrema bivittatum TaxID=194408 RepID=UPI0011295209|nr:zinc finger protein 354A-like isoform X3 [Rhinatrema bivittatum]